MWIPGGGIGEEVWLCFDRAAEGGGKQVSDFYQIRYAGSFNYSGEMWDSKASLQYLHARLYPTFRMKILPLSLFATVHKMNRQNAGAIAC